MSMDKDTAIKALKLLDEEIAKAGLQKVRLVMGGGAAMVIAYGFPGKTADVDAITTNSDFDTIKALAEKVATKLKIDHDWLNPYYGTYIIYLPSDATSRMENVYNGKFLQVDALSATDVLIMKLMAGRGKDMAHIKHLLKGKVNLKIVENRLSELKKKGLYTKEVEKALDLLDEMTDE